MVQSLWTRGQEKNSVAGCLDVVVPNDERRRLRAAFRLTSPAIRVRSSLQLPVPRSENDIGRFTVIVHRYEELIAGRRYLIEVSAVDASRWRAQIARLPGMPTALMPFYGPTPEEAARGLSKWLTMVAGGPAIQ